MIRVVWVVVAAVGLVFAASALAGGPPVGSWSAKISGAPAARFDGTWTLTFTSSGVYTVVENKQALIRGHATFAGATVTFHDESGAAACRGAQAAGSYAWKVTGKTLRLTAIKDVCSGRHFVLARRFVRH